MGDLRPIAVFDSGVGGLTVAAEIMRRLPGEEIVYLGDTARVPYGSRSVEAIVRYALECAEFLLGFDPKALVVACNTVSAVALGALRSASPVPVLDVVKPGAAAAVEFSLRGRIGVIATEATVRSGAYPRAILELNPAAAVVQSAAPLLVPIIEEGWDPGTAVVRGALERYMSPLIESRCDAIVLGCTHYPVIKHAFRTISADETFLVDSAEETAGALSTAVREKGWTRTVMGMPRHRFMVTDNPERFAAIGSRFLLHSLEGVELVRIGP